MNLEKVIHRLRQERAKLDEMIASFERLREVAATVREKRPPKRRGRTFMNEEERREVSVRMKKYWAARRKLGGLK